MKHGSTYTYITNSLVSYPISFSHNTCHPGTTVPVPGNHTITFPRRWEVPIWHLALMGFIYPLVNVVHMFGKVDRKSVLRNVHKALENGDLQYEAKEGDIVVLSAMGDDLPIGMMIVADDENRTLNIYCYLMFDIPEDARAKLIPELNTINNSINNGGFYMDDNEPKIYFKIVQSYFDHAPSVKTIQHLVMIAFKTVDVNDGKLKGLIPASAVKRDYMYS